MYSHQILYGLLGALSSSVAFQNASSSYTNPIVPGQGADPWVTRVGDYYYLTSTLATNITLYRSKALTDWKDAESKVLFNPDYGMPYSTDLWAPEIHAIDNRWYVIFTADPNYDSPREYSPEVQAHSAFSS